MSGHGFHVHGLHDHELTKKKWLEYGRFAAGAAGLTVGAMAAFHI
jgi:hypothetical protein